MRRLRGAASWIALGLAGALLLPAALSYAGALPAARFVRERIEIRVRPCEIEVRGDYVYRNPLFVPWTQGLRVPFPPEPRQPPPALVRARLLSGSGDELPVRWMPDPRVVVPLPPGGEATVRVSFTQRAPDRRATYLLTTTRPWGRALERGEYALVPEGVRIARSSLGPGATEVRENFLPSDDWSFEWTAEEPRCDD